MRRTILACLSKALHLANNFRLFLNAIKICVFPRTEACKTDKGLFNPIVTDMRGGGGGEREVSKSVDEGGLEYSFPSALVPPLSLF